MTERLHDRFKRNKYLITKCTRCNAPLPHPATSTGGCLAAGSPIVPRHEFEAVAREHWAKTVL